MFYWQQKAGQLTWRMSLIMHGEWAELRSKLWDQRALSMPSVSRSRSSSTVSANSILDMLTRVKRYIFSVLWRPFEYFCQFLCLTVSWDFEVMSVSLLSGCVIQATNDDDEDDRDKEILCCMKLWQNFFVISWVILKTSEKQKVTCKTELSSFAGSKLSVQNWNSV